MQGRSRAPLLETEPPAGWRREFYYEHNFEYATIPKSQALRRDHYKYIVFPELNPPHEELYDLSDDPDEARNLADNAENAALLRLMKRRLEAPHAAAGRTD